MGDSSRDKLDDGMIVVERREDIPPFLNEEDEAAYWDTHTLAPHLFTRRGPRQGSLAEKLSQRSFKPHAVLSRDMDAVYVYLRWGRPAVSRELDGRRLIDYAGDGSVIGVRFLQVSRGMDLSGVPEHDQIRILLEQHSPPIHV